MLVPDGEGAKLFDASVPFGPLSTHVPAPVTGPTAGGTGSTWIVQVIEPVDTTRAGDAATVVVVALAARAAAASTLAASSATTRWTRRRTWRTDPRRESTRSRHARRAHGRAPRRAPAAAA